MHVRRNDEDDDFTTFVAILPCAVCFIASLVRRGG
jgi:hypothetical protein